MSYDRIWRDPDEESVGLYPNLVVHDGRQRGSITIGRSRLPIWSVIYTAIEHDWDEVERGWAPTQHYGFTARDLAEFVHSICQVRGEFARLVLMLADAERSDYTDDNDGWSEAS